MSLSILHVVVPAHNEQAHVAACLDSLGVAIAGVRETHPTMIVRLTLVLDRCDDDTAAVVARSTTPVDVVTIEAGCVGAARAAGVARAAHLAVGTPPDSVWIANTDADCEVPSMWLLDHVNRSAEADLVTGAVRLKNDEQDNVVIEEWRRRHQNMRWHLYGANLGVRLSTYLEAGGFPNLPESEDVALVRAITEMGAARTGGAWVTTSARRRGRTPGGFAGYLRRLESELANEPHRIDLDLIHPHASH